MPSAGCSRQGFRAVISAEAAPILGISGGNGPGRMKKWKEGVGAKLSGPAASLINPGGTVLEANTRVASSVFWSSDTYIYMSWCLLRFGQSSTRVAKTIQLETDVLHFKQKSTVSLSYLALETGQSRAAVSCFSTLLTATALQISLSNYTTLGSRKTPSTGGSGQSAGASPGLKRLCYEENIELCSS